MEDELRYKNIYHTHNKRRLKNGQLCWIETIESEPGKITCYECHGNVPKDVKAIADTIKVKRWIWGKW